MIYLHTWINYTSDNPELNELLTLRKQQIQYLDDIQLIIFNQNDSIESLNQALGFDILTNHWNGIPYTEDSFYPSWEYIEEHPNWLEIAYLYNDNQGVLLFMEQPLSEPLKTLFRLNLTTSETPNFSN